MRRSVTAPEGAIVSLRTTLPCRPGSSRRRGCRSRRSSPCCARGRGERPRSRASLAAAALRAGCRRRRAADRRRRCQCHRRAARAAAARAAAAAAAGHACDHRRRAAGEAAAAGVAAVARGIDAAAAVGGVRGDQRAPARRLRCPRRRRRRRRCRRPAPARRRELDGHRRAVQSCSRSSSPAGRCRRPCAAPRRSRPPACSATVARLRHRRSLLSTALAGASGFFARLDRRACSSRARCLLGRRLRWLGLPFAVGGGLGWPDRAAAWPSAPRPRARLSVGFRTGSHGIRRKKIAQLMRTRSAMRRKRASSSEDGDQGRTRERNETRPRRLLRLAVAAEFVSASVHWRLCRPRTCARPSGSNLCGPRRTMSL